MTYWFAANEIPDSIIYPLSVSSKRVAGDGIFTAHESAYRKPDEYQKNLSKQVKYNYDRCVLFRSEEQCLGWLFSQDYFWN